MISVSSKTDGFFYPDYFITVSNWSTMNELVSLIVKKTGIPQATAQTIVNLVVDFLKKKLPAAIGPEIDALLSNDANVQQAENIVGGLFGKKK